MKSYFNTVLLGQKILHHLGNFMVSTDKNIHM